MAKSAEDAVKPRLHQPPEWTPHAAVWSAWPRVPDYWEGAIEGARREVAAFFRAITDPDPASGEPRGEHVKILVWGPEARRSAEKELSVPGIELIDAPYGDIWLRDTGPLFVRDKMGALTAACFQTNGWGKKFLMEFDDGVNSRIAQLLDLPEHDENWVLEGGAIDIDGEGTCLTTRQCVLNPNRNANLPEAEIGQRLERSLGVKKLIWLDEGLANDHTDGHIDNIARFIGPGKVLCMHPGEHDDPNATVLRTIAETLRRETDVHGKPLEVITVPSPGYIPGVDGEPMAASYMNFYISNTRVIVPLYGSRNDVKVLDLLKPHFPGREVMGLPSNNILVGGGSFHCITQQQPV